MGIIGVPGFHLCHINADDFASWAHFLDGKETIKAPTTSEIDNSFSLQRFQPMSAPLKIIIPNASGGQGRRPQLDWQ